LDLIGFDKKCLIRPRKIQTNFNKDTKKQDKAKQVAPQKKKTIRNTHTKKK
jgi:hypothetical protein